MSSSSAIEVSAHAYARAKERLSWKPETVDRMALRAYEIGKTYSDLKGQLKAYVDEKMRDCVGDIKYRIYGEYMYIFGTQWAAPDVLITVYKVPSGLVRLIPRGE